MKKIIVQSIVLFAILTTACSEWLDVSPQTEVKSDIFFDTEDGFKSALTGIYGRMTLDDLYGQKLSFLFIEQLAQRYDNSSTITQDQRKDYYYYATSENSKNTLASIWSNMYRNIANINNLLKNINEKGFNIITPGYRELIQGEALGLRAFHYFDLLRMWGPIYATDSLNNAVPWRDEFSPKRVPVMKANELMEKIINDLLRAEILLDKDGMEYLHNPSEPFVGYRQHRMNKYAVKALLARVYLWRGDHQNAAKKAMEVIQDADRKLQNNNQVDLSLFDEALFSLDMYDMEKRVSSYWTTGSAQQGDELWITATNATEVFDPLGVGINDMRYKNGFGFIHVNNRLMCRKYLPSSNVIYSEKIPLIRLSEMYLILAETENKDGGAEYLNDLRNVRGISRRDNVKYTDDEQWKELIQKEYSKEFFGEGQYFYFLKRHNLKTFWRCPFDSGMIPAYYVFRIPDDEVEFGIVETN